MATAALVFGALAACGLAVATFLMPAPANIYRTSIYDITLPQGWVCRMEGTELVCTPPEQPFHAMLIATMKYRNTKTDTLDAYVEHLETPATLQLPDGETMKSTVEHVGRRLINGRTWAEATHVNSEVKGYRTHYLGTFTAQVAILITFSVYVNDVEIYQPAMEDMVRSINLYQRLDDTPASLASSRP
ncbi:hypothetical protein D3C76_316520 [compost metagenome]